jgi:GMP synthase-like glutamine amidotransferase
MKILILQHEASGHPGLFRRILAEDGHDWTTVVLGEGDALPPVEGFDALWVMGGSMHVWEEDEHPWLGPEKALIREAVAERGLAFLGLCLGHQLLAEALGGGCAEAAAPEIGVLPVELTAHGAGSQFFGGVPGTFPCLQWHSAEVTGLPVGASVLASSTGCAVQAMSWGGRAFSTQFHMEADSGTAEEWTALPEWQVALDGALGPGGAARFVADSAERMTELNAVARQVYENWMRVAAGV